jgi:hypothetical protein
MAGQTAKSPTNERIVRLLEEIRAQLVDAQRRDQQIARDLARLLERK